MRETNRIPKNSFGKMSGRLRRSVGISSPIPPAVGAARVIGAARVAGAVVRTLVVAALVAIVFFIALPEFASAQSPDEMRVTNHTFAERVIQTADGGYIVQDVIVGFERGTHSFETLTQIVLPKGSHTIEMAIVDSKGVELERLKFGTLEADRDGWTQSLRGTWRNIRFESGGMHELLVYRNGKVVARFSLTVA